MSLCYWAEVFWKTGPGRWMVSQNRSIAGGWGLVTIVTRGVTEHNIQQIITRAAGAGHQKAMVKLSLICKNTLGVSFHHCSSPIPIQCCNALTIAMQCQCINAMCIVKPWPQTLSPKTQNPKTQKPKTMRPWADTRISWSHHPSTFMFGFW